MREKEKNIKTNKKVQLRTVTPKYALYMNTINYQLIPSVRGCQLCLLITSVLFTNCSRYCQHKHYSYIFAIVFFDRTL